MGHRSFLSCHWSDTPELLRWPALKADRQNSTTSGDVNANGRIPELPQIELSLLVDKAIRRLRPFDQDGDGFRDAILWEYALSLLEEFDPVVLISNDRVAFHVSKEELGLAPALVAEVSEKGHGGDGVLLYADLEAYLKATGTTDANTYAAVAELLAAEEAQIGLGLKIALGQADIEFLNGQGRIVTEQAHPPASIYLVDVTAPDDQNIALVTLEGDADLDIYVEWWDGTQPDLGSGTKTVTYTATATYDVEHGHLGDFSVATLRVDIDRDRDRFTNLRPLYGSGTMWRGNELLH